MSELRLRPRGRGWFTWVLMLYLLGKKMPP